MRGSTKSPTRGKIKNIYRSPFIQWASHVIIAGCQVGQEWFPGFWSCSLPCSFFLRTLNFTVLCYQLRAFIDKAPSLSSATRALTPFWSCRWGWSHPPGARSHQLPAFTITTVSISRCHKHGLCLLCRCSWGFRLWYLQGFEEAPVNLLLAICDAVQPVDPLLQLLQLAAWAMPSTHMLQARSTPKLGHWWEASGVSIAPGCRAASTLRSSLWSEVSDVPGMIDGPGELETMFCHTSPPLRRMRMLF